LECNDELCGSYRLRLKQVKSRIATTSTIKPARRADCIADTRTGTGLAMTGGGVPARAGVVVIGRNEGERLMACCRSILAFGAPIVYVDSGSSDESVRNVRVLGVDVIELDLRLSFTAARARNEGFQSLCTLAPQLRYVQFVDGDCEIVAGWLDRAIAWLDAHGDVAVVCGRRRERYPRRSVYNMLCDIEWDTPVGEARACGGDALVRVEAFQAVRGFRPELIAGEEPELCVRLRQAGWRVWRLDAEMTLHDAAILRFGQWWARAVRAGYAYAQAVALHGRPPERHGVRESRGIWLWAAVVPVAVAVAVSLWGTWGLALLLVYPAQVLRLGLRGSRSNSENVWRAVFLVLGKFPEWIGQLRYLRERWVGGRARLIEYK